MELSHTDSSIVIGLHRIVLEMDRETKRICQPYGLTIGQFAVMEALHHKGPSSIGQVKESILSTDGTIPVVVRNLERQGYVTRTQDAADKRRAVLDLTESGKKLIEKVYPENTAMIEGLLAAWSDEEKRAVRELLGAYRKAHRGHD